MDFEIINPLEIPEWDDLVLTAGNYSFFHSSAWMRVLCESYGYRPSFFGCSRNGKLSVVIPMLEVDSLFTGCRGVSLPFSDYCEPITFDNSGFPDVTENLIGAGRTAGWKYVEFRGRSLFGQNAPVWSRFFHHTLRLSSQKDLFPKLHSNTARNIKKAKSSGLQIVVDDSFEAIQKYYRLHRLTRQRQGVPPQPFSFFKKIHEHICSKGRGLVILAYSHDKPVAGGVFFHFGRKAMYKYGASDMNFSKLGGNAAVMWEAISHFANEGYEVFCFGRTDFENEGLRRFKLGFGSDEHVLEYHRFDLMKNAFVEGAPKNWLSFPGLMKRMPVFALEAIGLSYRHFG